jgi:TatA/E family protein of Tat protein translocase
MFRNPTTDLIVVLVIVLLIFGPKRLPGLGRSIGQGMREFKESITGESKGDEEADHPELTQASASEHPAAPAAPVAAPGAPATAAPAAAVAPARDSVPAAPAPAAPARDPAEVGPERRS